MKDGKTLTFIGLFDEVERIEIPIIQRDYAQGRIEAVEVREQFLDAIKNALLTPVDELSQPLDLDFVYGNFEGNNSEVFSVLDGQQRLTTLFLLHWYLAIKSEKYEDFSSVFIDKDHSRFTYKTRPSTSEFFDALVNANVSVSQIEDYGSLSRVLQNRQWFFLSWKQDPTVQSCLRMIDAIHQLFVDCDSDLYMKLTNKITPYVTFQYLNLKSFDLSDELYIKMNARGKPLTDFENFKAWLFGKINGLALAESFEQKVDQQWTDVFWQMSLKGRDQFDELYLRFFNLMAFYSSCERVDGSFALLDLDKKNWLRTIRITKGYVSHRTFEQYDNFNSTDIQCIESTLEYLSISDDASSSNLFRTVMKSSDYVTQAQFYALVVFINNAPVITEWDENTKINLARWIRVSNNLIHNFRIDELAPFLPTIRALNELSDQCFELYEHLSGDDIDTPGFTKNQWQEERLKAKLILDDSRWEGIFLKFERHVYLKGKVGFLLDMALEDNVYSIERFEEYADTAAVLLSDEILRSEEFLLQRALLTLDDYLIYDGSNRYSFGLHNRGTYRERSDNWFSIVDTHVFKNLIKTVGGDGVKESLQAIVTSVDCGGWRELVVQNPEVISYCGRRLVHKQNGQIYLLTLSTFRGYHSELRTFVLDKRFKEIFQNNKKLPDGINRFGYEAVYGDRAPSIWFKLTEKRTVRVRYETGQYKVFETLPFSNDNPELLVEKVIDTPTELKDMLCMVLQEDELG